MMFGTLNCNCNVRLCVICSAMVCLGPAGQLVPFASQTVPPSAVYTFPVPELAYPAPSIPRGSIQLAYTAGWRDKPPQGNSQGLFPGSKWRGGVDFNATVVVGPEERGSPYSVSVLCVLADHVLCVCDT